MINHKIFSVDRMTKARCLCSLKANEDLFLSVVFIHFHKDATGKSIVFDLVFYYLKIKKKQCTVWLYGSKKGVESLIEILRVK